MVTPTMEILPESFVNMASDKKNALLKYILFRELYLDDRVLIWLKEVLKSEKDDFVRAKVVEAIGAHVDEEEVRDELKKISRESSKGSATYNAIKEFLITALADDMEEVKKWGIELLKEREEIDPEDEKELLHFLASNLEDEDLPPRLRWHAALGMANLGTRAAINKLSSYYRELLLKIPLDTGTFELIDDYGVTVNRFLKEKVASSLGLAAENISLYGKKEEVVELLKKYDEQINYLEEPNPVTRAIRQIEAAASPVEKNSSEAIVEEWRVAASSQEIESSPFVEEEKIIEDDEGQYKFRILMFKDKTVEVTLEEFLEETPPERLHLSIITTCPEAPVVTCTLIKDPKSDEISGEIEDVPFELEHIEKIKGVINEGNDD